MRVHHLNCGSLCPWGGPLMYGWNRDPAEQRLTCHCLLIETERHGLVLVDTGLGLRDVEALRPRLSPLFIFLNRIRPRPEETAARQIRELGLSPADVRHIVLTHLDFDHAGGIEDFPHARVHVLESELRAASQGRGFIARRRYRPLQWSEEVDWQAYTAGGEPWFGFDSVRDLEGLPPEILLVPLTGHTWGHCGVAVQSGDGWLLHAGDAYFHEHEMDADPHCTPGLRAYQWLMEVDRSARLANQARLRSLAQRPDVGLTLFCAHDLREFARLRDRSPYDTA